MPDESPDQLIDRQLTAVPVPAGLVAQLRAIAAWTDDQLDAHVRDVPVPDGLVARICADVADWQLDERLRAVPDSFRVVPRARTIPVRRPRRRVLQTALAASLMLVLSLGYFATLGGLLSLVGSQRSEQPALVVVDRGPLDLLSPPESAVTVFPVPAAARPANPFRYQEDPITAMPVLAIADGVTPGPAGVLAAEIPTVWNPWDNWLLMRWGVTGYARVDDRDTMNLTSIVPPDAGGLAAPLSRSFDREFLFRDGAHPPVMTAVDRAAAAISPPLSTETDSFERARQLVEQGRLPAADQVRVEDFLSAVDYQLAPAEPGELAIRTAAGPSVFNPRSAQLLQIAVRSGPSPAQARGGTHLVLALETSAAMQRGGYWQRARQAVEQMLDHLRNDDRLSLVVFADEPFVLVDEAARDSASDIFQLLEQLQTGGGVDLGAGLQQAVATAIETETAECTATRLALITASRPVLEPRAAAGIRRIFDEATRGDFRCDVFDLERGSESQSQWTQLAGRAACTVHQVPSAEHLRWDLIQLLTGASTLAATDVALQVQFNPRAVAAYRLIGHEATAAGGLLAGSVTSDLHVQQEATVLFEVWLYPVDEQQVATVQLSWTDPDTGRARQVGPQRVSSLQFATSFEGAPLSLQAAAVAAEAAEVLRQGYNFDVATPAAYEYFPKPQSVQHVLAAAGRVNPRLAERPSFQRMIRLMQAVDTIGRQRRPAAARAGIRSVAGGRWRETGG
jgi:Ca-activated chloride channel family protein